MYGTVEVMRVVSSKRRRVGREVVKGCAAARNMRMWWWCSWGRLESSRGIDVDDVGDLAMHMVRPGIVRVRAVSIGAGEHVMGMFVSLNSVLRSGIRFFNAVNKTC